ncbi:Protein of unknown function [Spirosomataceae bacterium TFI 002]|nr:Protein of unknown function [Spirosomataceae bacterium TFI 002]
MNKYFISFLILIAGFGLKAQITPQPSPGASFSQTVGITRIIVEYSRPAVRGREIFGGLVPNGKIWRTGANAPTIFSVSNDVIINGAELRAGDYAVMSIPFEKEWILIFSNNLETTEATYNEADDELRVHVESYEIELTESFTIDISNISNDAAYLNFYWANKAITVEIKVNNEATVNSAVEQKTLETAGAFLQAAEYFVNNNLNTVKALEYANHSIELKQTFRNTWIKSVILRKLKRNTEALEFAEKAKVLGETDPVYSFFKYSIDQSIVELRALVPRN